MKVTTWHKYEYLYNHREDMNPFYLLGLHKDRVQINKGFVINLPFNEHCGWEAYDPVSNSVTEAHNYEAYNAIGEETMTFKLYDGVNTFRIIVIHENPEIVEQCCPCKIERIIIYNNRFDEGTQGTYTADTNFLPPFIYDFIEDSVGTFDICGDQKEVPQFDCTIYEIGQVEFKGDLFSTGNAEDCRIERIRQCIKENVDFICLGKNIQKKDGEYSGDESQDPSVLLVGGYYVPCFVSVYLSNGAWGPWVKTPYYGRLIRVI